MYISMSITRRPANNRTMLTPITAIVIMTVRLLYRRSFLLPFFILLSVVVVGIERLVVIELVVELFSVVERLVVCDVVKCSVVEGL